MGADAPLPTVANFQSDKFLGFWYEIYSVPQLDEKFCTCQASNFSSVGGTTSTHWKDGNYCKRFGGMEHIPLDMWITDVQHPERFAIGTNPNHLMSKLWVISTDYDSYALIGDPNRKSLWIYGREAGLNRALYSNLTDEASNLGYDISQLKMTTHDKTCSYGPPPPPPLPTMANFSADAFKGFWYEIYSIPQLDEKFCTCQASNFTEVTTDHWKDGNYCRRFGGMEHVPLDMWVVDAAHPERFAIGSSADKLFSKLWVIATDYSSYALIGDPNRKSLWMYGRQSGLSPDIHTKLNSMASDLGFDVSLLKMVDHTGPCKY